MSVPAAMRFAVIPYREADTDRVDCSVFRGLDFLQDLVESQFAEGIDAGGHQDDVLLAFDAIQPVERVEYRVEQIGFRKPGMRNWFSAPYTARLS
jgi:hypothetical protein